MTGALVFSGLWMQSYGREKEHKDSSVWIFYDVSRGMCLIMTVSSIKADVYKPSNFGTVGLNYNN
jgi:hypothetical protein